LDRGNITACGRHDNGVGARVSGPAGWQVAATARSFRGKTLAGSLEKLLLQHVLRQVRSRPWAAPTKTRFFGASCGSGPWPRWPAGTAPGQARSFPRGVELRQVVRRALDALQTGVLHAFVVVH